MIRLRILFVSPFFVIGGTEEVAMTLARYLKTSGHDVTFCLLHRVSYVMLAELERAGFAIHNWTELPIEQKVIRLRELAKEFDIVHAHLSYTDGVVGKVLEERGRARVVITAQLPNMDLSAYRNVDAIASCCEYGGRTLRVPANIISVSILNGSDVTLQLPELSKSKARAGLGLPLEGLILGRISRLDDEKFPTNAYDAWKRLLIENPTVTGVLIGDGNVRSKLVESVKIDGLENRLLLPGSTRERITWLKAFDLFVYSTGADACPLVLVEAMGAGVPIVAPDFCGIPELIRHQDTGLLYPHNNWDQMCAAAKRLIEDQALAESLGREARRSYLDSLTGEAMCRKYVELYERVLRSTTAAVERLEAAPAGMAVQCAIQSARVGFGRLGLRGELGYDGKLQTKMEAASAEILSAHAPSRVVLRAGSGGTIRIRAQFNDTAQKSKVIARAVVSDLDGTVLADLGLFTPSVPTPVAEVECVSTMIFALNIECSTVYSAHTLWVLDGAHIEFADAETALTIARQELLSRAGSVQPGNADSHELFVLTCAARFEMALRNVASHLVCACRKPKRVLLCSFDDLTPLKGALPPWCEFLSGSEAISKALEEHGLSRPAIEKIKQENMFAKYAAPRLLMGSRVLVSDDDVIWAGPAKEMLECQETFFFLEDLPGFYGLRSMELFRCKQFVDESASAPPYLCAGLYLMNNGPMRDPKFISEIIEKAESHRDEQSAVGMETRMKGVTYKIGRYPDYHHGAYGPQPILERFNAMHLQGCLMTLRDHLGFQLQFMSQALESHANARKFVPETREAHAVFIPIYPSHAEMLEMNLSRAQQCVPQLSE